MGGFLTSATAGVASGLVMLFVGGLIALIKRPFKRVHEDARMLSDSVKSLTNKIDALGKQVAKIEGALPQITERVGNLERRPR